MIVIYDHNDATRESIVVNGIDLVSYFIYKHYAMMRKERTSQKASHSRFKEILSSSKFYKPMTAISKRPIVCDVALFSSMIVIV